MSTKTKAGLRVEGTVAPGFESVRDLYVHNMETKAERNTQLCVYHRGEKVVDLWASAIGDDQFSADSLVNVFSSGKSLESIAMASLFGKGLLDYREKISTYWPEFAANGKADLTVADLMRHEAGLAAFDESLDPESLLAENIKKNQVGAVIEPHAPSFPEPTRKQKQEGTESRREYHAITRGWIANEVFRRIDPAGRTIGEFLRQDIAEPLGVDANIGVREADLPRLSRVVPLGFVFQFLQSLVPRFLGRKIEHNIFQLLGRIFALLPGLRRSTVSKAPPPFKGWKGTGIGMFNDPMVARGETPSANASCSARGLAKIAAMIAGGGAWKGTPCLSEAACQAMHEDPIPADMLIMPTSFTQGGVNEFSESGSAAGILGRSLNQGREGFFGWMGFGGSIFQWHPHLDIGFGYVPTSLYVLDLCNERGKGYQREVLRCIERLSQA